MDSDRVIFKCTQCSYQTIDARQMRSHHLEKHPLPEEIQWHSCDNCAYKTPIKGELESHIRLEHGPECLKDCDTKPNEAGPSNSQAKNGDGPGTSESPGKKFQCSQCNYQSNRRHDLKRHMELKHDIAIAQELVEVHAPPAHAEAEPKSNCPRDNYDLPQTVNMYIRKEEKLEFSSSD